MIDFAHNFLDMKSIDFIIPVPLSTLKLRQRQFNQAYLLAKPLAYAFSKRLENRSLLRIKSGPAQVNLSRAERLKNVRGAFRVKNTHLLENKNILLIDDVLTTYATVNECARVLRNRGVNRVDVFTLARRG